MNKQPKLFLLPNREHRLAQVLKECLGSITCHAAMLAHVSPLPEHYHETLATIQLASRLHRMRRRRVKVRKISVLVPESLSMSKVSQVLPYSENCTVLFHTLCI